MAGKLRRQKRAKDAGGKPQIRHHRQADDDTSGPTRGEDAGSRRESLPRGIGRKYQCGPARCGREQRFLKANIFQNRLACRPVACGYGRMGAVARTYCDEILSFALSHSKHD